MRFYKTIDDLPVWNFLKVQKTQDVRYLLILEDYYELPKVKEDILVNTWESITDSMMSFMGNSDTYEIIVSRLKDIAMMRIELALTEDSALVGLIKKKIKEVNSLIQTISKKQEKQDMDYMIASLSKYYGQLDLHSLTVKMMLSYFEVLKKEAENGKSNKKK